MSGVLPIAESELVVPADATTLEGFRRWRRTLGENAPKVHFIDGDLWFDMSPQSYRSHLPVASAINAVLWSLVTDSSLGRYFGDGGWVTQESSGLSTEPDGFFVRWETFRSNQARLAEDSEVELQGRPDMVLEVVSKTSVKKDTEVLRRKYAQAGVPEFWLVDARGDEPAFQLLVLSAGTYAAAEPGPEGSLRSPTLGRAFRLRKVTDPLGQPDYRLDVLREAGAVDPGS